MGNYITITYTPSRTRWISDAEAQKLRQDIAGADAENRNRYRARKADYDEMLRMAAKLYGSRSKEVKYLLRSAPTQPPSHKGVLKKLDAELARRDRVMSDRQRARDYRARAEEARQQLVEAGYIEWDDFYPSRAITERKRLLECVDGVWRRRASAEPMLEAVP